MGIFFDFQDIICYVGKNEACSMVERKESDIVKRKITDIKIHSLKRL